MNTTSKGSLLRQAPRSLRVGRIAATLGLILLSACIQGPWDFYPSNPPTFHGIYLSGYALSGKPLNQICFEHMLDLAEEATQAFAFYDSADVQVTGSFNGAVRTMKLLPQKHAPNCFIGDSLALVEKGQAYTLEARIVWDSAGRKVTSRLTSTAHVPVRFSISRTAVAPSLAKTGGVPSNVFTLEFFAQLPPNVQTVMIKEYGDTLQKLQSDTAALARYFKVNGTKIQARLLGLLEKDKFTYHEGDTLFYLNGALNTLSHYYTSDRSSDVNSVLITQRFDPQGTRPETRFDAIIGIPPKPGDYYFPGDIRRLIVYPDAKSRQGWNLLDSMGVVNTWFQTIRNRLYFYGFEQTYTQYLASNGLDGNGPDARVKPKFNVTGGEGVFAGAIPDSFDVNIVTDPLTKSYPLPAAHASYCDTVGWSSNKDCREYYRGYCESKTWAPSECRQNAVEACLEADLNTNIPLKLACSPVADSAKKDTTLFRQASTQFCIAHDFTSANPTCAEYKTQCLETMGSNSCKQNLWTYCLDNNWEPNPCKLGLVSYCKDKPRLSEVLCRNADAYCRANPGEALCK